VSTELPDKLNAAIHKALHDACELGRESGQREIAALEARVAELEAIVRAVAELDPVTGILSPDEDSLQCEICGATTLSGVNRKTFQHPDDCAWLQARKAVGMDAP
jgi:hypothetical protein